MNDIKVLAILANQPLVMVGGCCDLSESYFDSAKNCEHNSNAGAFYDFILCGGEPYSRWLS